MKKHWWESNGNYFDRINRDFYKWIEKESPYHPVIYKVKRTFKLFGKCFPESPDTLVFLNDWLPFTVNFISYIDDNIVTTYEGISKELLDLGIVSLLVVRKNSNVRYNYIKSAVIIPYTELFDYTVEKRYTWTKNAVITKKYLFEKELQKFYKENVEDKKIKDDQKLPE